MINTPILATLIGFVIGAALMYITMAVLSCIYINRDDQNDGDDVDCDPPTFI